MRTFLRLEDFTTGLALRLSVGFLVIAASLALFQVVTRFVFANPSTCDDRCLGQPAGCRQGDADAVH